MLAALMLQMMTTVSGCGDGKLFNLQCLASLVLVLDKGDQSLRLGLRRCRRGLSKP